MTLTFPLLQRHNDLRVGEDNGIARVRCVTMVVRSSACAMVSQALFTVAGADVQAEAGVHMPNAKKQRVQRAADAKIGALGAIQNFAHRLGR